MSDVPVYRLYMLRAAYLLLAVGQGVQQWPVLIHGLGEFRIAQSTVTCMLWALSVLAILGLRYPLQMLPLIFFEIVWKCAWLLMAALPKWRAGPVDDAMLESTIACLMVVIFPIVMPWGYVWRN